VTNRQRRAKVERAWPLSRYVLRVEHDFQLSVWGGRIAGSRATSQIWEHKSARFAPSNDGSPNFTTGQRGLDVTAPLRAGTAFDARRRKLVPIVPPRPRACDEERPPGGLQGLPYCAVSAGPAPRCALAQPRIRSEIEIEIEIESDVVRDEAQRW
jgi:hypothetical protein